MCLGFPEALREMQQAIERDAAMQRHARRPHQRIIRKGGIPRHAQFFQKRRIVDSTRPFRLRVSDVVFAVIIIGEGPVAIHRRLVARAVAHKLRLGVSMHDRQQLGLQPAGRISGIAIDDAATLRPMRERVDDLVRLAQPAITMKFAVDQQDIAIA